MSESEYRAVHGWVEDVEKNPAVAGEHRLLVKLEEGRLLAFAMGQPGSPLTLGDEISVAVDHAQPDRVLALVDHSTGEGTHFFAVGSSQWPTGTDLLAVAAVAGSFAVALGGMAVPVLAAFVFAYWLFGRCIPEARRQGAAARIDYLLDKDYFCWRAGLDRRRDVR
jgi:hypothetical protein